MPVDLFPATRSEHVPLRMLDADGTPLARRYFCSRDNRELDDDDIVRGFELDGRYIVVTDKELEALEPDKSRDIDLRRFVDRDAIDPRFFANAYYLTPGGGSTKAYRLLAETMDRAGRAGIATFVMRGKEYLVAILAENGILRAETLRFEDELRTESDIGLPAKPRVNKADVTRFQKAVRARSKTRLDTRELEDEHAAELRKLALAKQKKGRDVVTAPETAEQEDEAEVIDLVQVIKSRMKRSRAKPQPRKRSSTAKRSRAPSNKTTRGGRRGKRARGASG